MGGIRDERFLKPDAFVQIRRSIEEIMGNKEPFGLISSDYMIGTKKHKEKSFMKEFEDVGAIL